jgi:signal transduction histidine kinase
MRLGGQRAMISLFDRTHQYILAEGTGSPDLDGHDNLWLGCCVLPKENGVCKDVSMLPLSQPPDDPAIVGGSALVIPNMKESEHIEISNLANGLSQAQFYAGVPIVSPRGITIGAYCIFDTQPRQSGLDEASIRFMKRMAATTMDYLDMMQSKNQHTKAKKMIFGLGSFVEGKTTLRDSWLEANEQDATTGRSGETVEGQLNKQQQDLQEAQNHPPPRKLPDRPTGTGKGHSPRLHFSHDVVKSHDSDATAPDSATTPSGSNQSDLETNEQKKTGSNQPEKVTFRSSVSSDNVPDESVPVALQKIFSRAANLIRESIEVEGVAFLDARIESFGGLVGDEHGKAREAWARDKTASSEDSTDSGDCESPATPSTTSSEEDATTCRTLGSSTSKSSTIDDDSRSGLKSGHEYAVRGSVLKAILNRYPNGKIFNYNESGSLSDDSGSGTTSRISAKTSRSKAKKKRREPNHKQDANDLIRVIEGARSIIFLPLWDSHKSRWISGVLVWTNSPERVFQPKNELAYLRAFGNSVMAEVHRLDVEMAEKAKTNLVSSISHELRSPLHGILGTSDILGDTAMNALQQGMVHTIESCGRTLLDTMNNLLDFTYIDKFKDNHQQTHGNGRHEKQFEDPGQHNQPGSSENSRDAVQLDAVLEEVIESVFAGHSFYHQHRAQSRHVNKRGLSKTAVLPSKQVTVIFDIHEAAEWNFFTQAGCWRRILMNVFGNALKYTTSGFIYVGLKATKVPRQGIHHSAGSRNPDSEYMVTLTVKDTGQGIDVDYLRNGLFTPFSQEDTLAPGSGLGLSIVRQALGSLHGSIEVSSEKNRGTEISIEVPMSHVTMTDTSDASSPSAAYSFIRNQAQNKTIGLVGFGSSLASEQDATLYSSLERMCHEWLHLTVKKVSLQGDITPCDFYLMVHTDPDSPDVEGNQLLNLDQTSKLSPLVVICQSPETAHKMFARTMSRSRESVVEFISQPCGPRKFAKTLELCIRRLDGEGANNAKETRWVELPESSHLPLDIGPRNAPDNRMKISKRPMADTEVSQDSDKFDNPSNGRIHKGPSVTQRVSSSGTTSETNPGSCPRSVLLVEDNHVNLNILVAYVKKEGWNCTTATNGLEAVRKFQAHPGKFAMVILGTLISLYNSNSTSNKIRSLDARHEWL